ncbi:MAG: FtsW/RodA/SpoVE family cell cycle protein [Actinomycetia bacterium]|nr:FtsW/RodA/SpoVE family cell cycle protein [Actinomycetes bacterium]
MLPGYPLDPTPEHRREWWRHVDWGLIIAALGLSIIGAVLVYSATRSAAGSTFLIRHLINTGIGVVMALGVMRLSPATLRLLAPVAYVLGILGLLAVLGRWGSTINGSRSWIELPIGMSIQPSELVKISVILALGALFAASVDRRVRLSAGRLALGLVIAGLPILLILRQPDLGSALVLVVLAAGIFVVTGIRLRWIAAGALLAVAAGVAAWFSPLISQYQRDRITVFLNPEVDPLGIGYQISQVAIAIRRGGWTGTGLFEGPSTQGGLIPFQETDFVFSVAAEELGYLGALGIIVVYAFLVARAVLVGIRGDDAFTHLVAAGVATWFTAQVVENIGMNLQLTPVTGLPLPFLSYGGSSMFACWIGIGLLLSVHLHTPRR